MKFVPKSDMKKLAILVGALMASGSVLADTWNAVLREEMESRLLDVRIEKAQKMKELQMLNAPPPAPKKEEKVEKKADSSAPLTLSNQTVAMPTLQSTGTINEENDKFVLVSIYGVDSKNLLADVIFNGELYTVSSSANRGTSKLGDWKVVGISEQAVRVEKVETSKKGKGKLVQRGLSFKNVALTPIEDGGIATVNPYASVAGGIGPSGRQQPTVSTSGRPGASSAVPPRGGPGQQGMTQLGNRPVAGQPGIPQIQ